MKRFALEPAPESEGPIPRSSAQEPPSSASGAAQVTLRKTLLPRAYVVASGDLSQGSVEMGRHCVGGGQSRALCPMIVALHGLEIRWTVGF